MRSSDNSTVEPGSASGLPNAFTQTFLALFEPEEAESLRQAGEALGERFLEARHWARPLPKEVTALVEDLLTATQGLLDLQNLLGRERAEPGEGEWIHQAFVCAKRVVEAVTPLATALQIPLDAREREGQRAITALEALTDRFLVLTGRKGGEEDKGSPDQARWTLPLVNYLLPACQLLAPEAPDDSPAEETP